MIFHGNFHGATDALLAAGGSGVATLGLPGTAGVPAGAVGETMVVPYNVVPQLDEAVAGSLSNRLRRIWVSSSRSPDSLKVFVKSVIAPERMLIFDEVISGFRLGPGGAQERYGVKPDLTTFGKVIGGGLPIGAVGGHQTIMETLSPLGPVFHAGTLAGNPIAIAAGLAALNLLKPEVYTELEQRASELSSLLDDACKSAGVPAHFPRVGTLVGAYFGEGGPVRNFDDATTTDEAAYARFFHAMLNEGVAMAPGAYEALFVGLGHDDSVMTEVASVRSEPP